MFEKLKNENGQNGDVKVNDAAINLVPGDYIKFKIGGRVINLEPPSYQVNGIIERFMTTRMEGQEKIISDFREKFKPIEEEYRNVFDEYKSATEKAKRKTKTKKSEEKNDELDEFYLTEKLNKLSSESSWLEFELKLVAGEWKRKYAWLIVSNALDRSWIDEHEGFDFPSDEVLEKIIPFDFFFKYASPQEVDSLIEVYTDLRLGYDRSKKKKPTKVSSIGSGSGEQSRSTTAEVSKT